MIKASRQLSRREFAGVVGAWTGVGIGVALLAACGSGATATLPATAPSPTATNPVAPRPTATTPATPTATAVMLSPTVTHAPTSTTQPSGTSTATVGTSDTVEVKIVDFAFVPATLTVAVGTTVVWRNTGVEHTTMSLDNLWSSTVLEAGDTFRYTFTKPGTYKYICGLHPEMKATVVVQ